MKKLKSREMKRAEQNIFSITGNKDQNSGLGVHYYQAIQTYT